MYRNVVKWKSVNCKCRQGQSAQLNYAEIIDIRYRGTLLPRILSMQYKTPISFESAIQMLSEKQSEAFAAGRFGDNPEQYGWYDLNFLDWLSVLGYHIELTGEEFETYALTDKLI
jgi:hypothetical protein